MIQSEEEYALIKEVEEWRELEDQKASLELKIHQAKEAIAAKMNELGELEQLAAEGKVTLKKTKKVNYIVDVTKSEDVNKKKFLEFLKKQGKYDQFTEEKVIFSTKKLVEYVEAEEDDFNGQLELDDDFEIRFYGGKK